MTAIWQIIKILVFLTGVSFWALVLIIALCGVSFRIGGVLGRRLLLSTRTAHGDPGDADAAPGARVPRDDDDAAWLAQLGRGLKSAGDRAASGRSRIFTSKDAPTDAPDGVYGPNTAAILRFFDELRRPATWTPERVKACRTSRWMLSPAHISARLAARREAVLDHPPRELDRVAAWETARSIGHSHRSAWAAGWAAAALVVRDLIDEKQFAILTKPFADLIAAYDTTENPNA